MTEPTDIVAVNVCLTSITPHKGDYRGVLTSVETNKATLLPRDVIAAGIDYKPAIAPYLKEAEKAGKVFGSNGQDKFVGLKVEKGDGVNSTFEITRNPKACAYDPKL